VFYVLLLSVCLFCVYAWVQIREKACQADLSRGKFRSSGCFGLLDAVLDATGSLSAGKMTMYDSRLFSKTSGSYPPGHEDVEVRRQQRA
jgi:hypothetical protein